MQRLILFLGTLFAMSAVVADECDAVLEKTGTNLQVRHGANVSNAAQANAFCDERYEQMSTEQKAELDAQYKVFSGSASAAASTVKEYRSKYCSRGKSSQFSSSETSEYVRQVYESSVQAWRECRAMQSKGLVVAALRTVDDQSVDVGLAYRSGGSGMRLTSVRVAPAGAFQCNDQQNRRLDGVVLVGGSSTFTVPLNPNMYSFQCVRTVTPGVSGAFSAPASTITINTNVSDKPFQISFPAVASPDIATQNANALSNAIQSLKTELEKTKAELQLVNARADRLGRATKFVLTNSEGSCPTNWVVVSNVRIMSGSVAQDGRVQAAGFAWTGVDVAGFPTFNPTLCMLPAGTSP